jgi:hypothetical protein
MHKLRPPAALDQDQSVLGSRPSLQILKLKVSERKHNKREQSFSTHSIQVMSIKTAKSVAKAASIH